MEYPILWNCAKKRVYFWCGLWEASCLPANWSDLNLDSPTWFWNIFLVKSVFGTLIQLNLTLSILDILCKNKTTDISMVYEAKKIWVQNQSELFFAFCKINMYGLECFRCECHELLSRIHVSFLPSSWDFTLLIIMVHHPCTW